VTNAPPRPAKRAFTGRAAVLAVVLLGLLVTIAYPLQEYLRQRGELAALHDQRSTLQASVDALNAESARWKDPAFVKQQAKERLYFVAPGEKTYVVIGAPDAAAPTAAPRSATDALSGTWYERVWSTVAAAGKATGKASSGATQSATGASGAAK
jgi:cell division protein FtsB